MYKMVKCTKKVTPFIDSTCFEQRDRFWVKELMSFAALFTFQKFKAQLISVLSHINMVEANCSMN